MLFFILGVFAIILMITANIRSRQRPLPGKKPFLTWDRLGIMLSCAFLFLILVLQDTHSNGDLLQYYNRYTSLQYTSISSFLNGFWDMKDPVYHFLSLLFGKLGFDFYAWKSLIAFVFVLGIYKQIQYYSTNPSISFLAILTLGLNYCTKIVFFWYFALFLSALKKQTLFPICVVGCAGGDVPQHRADFLGGLSDLSAEASCAECIIAYCCGNRCVLLCESDCQVISAVDRNR